MQSGGNLMGRSWEKRGNNFGRFFNSQGSAAIRMHSIILARLFRVLIAIGIALTIWLPGSSRGDQLLFTLSGVTFDDGAVAAGSFILDPTHGQTTSFGTFD